MNTQRPAFIDCCAQRYLGARNQEIPPVCAPLASPTSETGTATNVRLQEGAWVRTRECVEWAEQTGRDALRLYGIGDHARVNSGYCYKTQDTKGLSSFGRSSFTPSKLAFQTCSETQLGAVDYETQTANGEVDTAK